MHQTTGMTLWIESTFADDPDMAELIELFVGEMPARVEAIRAEVARGDWKRLAWLAHQLKGCAGGYGFDPITAHAKRLEFAIEAGRPDAEIAAAAENLAEACSRVRRAE